MQENRFELFVTLTANASKEIQRLKAHKMQKYRLTAAHTNCICRLAKAGSEGLTQTELVRLEMMDPSQISRVLRELWAKGYVQPEGEGGTYRRHYRLTEEGMRVARELDVIIEEIRGYVVDGLSEADMDTFYRVLGHISDRLAAAQEIYIGEDEP